jgi:hypothetical protein
MNRAEVAIVAVILARASRKAGFKQEYRASHQVEPTFGMNGRGTVDLILEKCKVRRSLLRLCGREPKEKQELQRIGRYQAATQSLRPSCWQGPQGHRNGNFAVPTVRDVFQSELSRRRAAVGTIYTYLSFYISSLYSRRTVSPSRLMSKSLTVTRQEWFSRAMPLDAW